MSITQRVTDDLVNFIQTSIAELGKSLSEQSNENFEETILLLQDLNTLRGEAIKLKNRFPSAAPIEAAESQEESSEVVLEPIESEPEDSAATGPEVTIREEITPPMAAEAEAPPQKPLRKARQPKEVKEAKAPRQPRQQASSLVEGEYTPLQEYKPFLLRVMMKQRGSQRFVDIQKAMLKLMKEEGAAKPLDEAPVGASGVIRYVAQSAAIRKQLLNQGMITGNGTEGFRITPVGRKYLDENFAEGKANRADSAETHKS